MNYEVVKECTALSDEEKITFPQVVKRLMEADIELYYADLLNLNKTYYAKNTAFTIPCSKKHAHQVADSFDSQGVTAAIKQIQSGKIQYQEFVKKIMDSGVISYMVFVLGRKAIYFGRRGEQHIEEFPK